LFGDVGGIVWLQASGTDKSIQSDSFCNLNHGYQTWSGYFEAIPETAKARMEMADNARPFREMDCRLHIAADFRCATCDSMPRLP